MYVYVLLKNLMLVAKALLMIQVCTLHLHVINKLKKRALMFVFCIDVVSFFS